MLEQVNHVEKEKDKMSKTDDAEKIIELLNEYNEIVSNNKTELIIDFAEKNLRFFADDERANLLINNINYFTNKKKIKNAIYSYIFALFTNRILDENFNENHFTASLEIIVGLIAEANKNLKAEREISKGYKYVIDKYALDKLQNIQWHKYPEDKPKCESGYVVIFDNNGYLEAKHCQWIKGMFTGIKNTLVKAWIEMPYVIEGKGL